ncbi:NUDIX hydrolase [bacterium]|nr:NUDIX hydrolase [bacterium]
MADFLEQAGAVPYRWVEGQLQVLLVTSRSSGDWIVPKGMIDPGQNSQQTALQEAYEEAGVRGELGPHLGVVHGSKRGYPIRVELFALHVRQQLSPWMEQDFRRRKWFEADLAALQLARDPALAELVKALRQSIR